MRTGFFCLKIGSKGLPLWTRQWTFGYHETSGVAYQ